MSGAYRYGDPSSSPVLLGPKPPCWGSSKYDNEDRECRACGFQNTCRDYVLKSKPAQTTAPVPVASYFNQFQPQQPYAASQAITQPAKVIVPVAPTPQIINIKPTTQSQPTPDIKDRYGQFQDPMFMSIKTTPSVMRPQLTGETFAHRIVKNMVLASVESALGEFLLGVRQLLWAPIREDENKDKNK